MYYVHFFVALALCQAGAPLVFTKLGPTRGVRIRECSSCLPRMPRAVDAFLGIPYAEAPVGDLRLAESKPFRGRMPEFATELPPECPQRNQSYTMSEDCLYLNIYRPSVWARTNTKPVMVWIHGGAFRGGSGNRFEGGPLASKEDVIVVTFNYRLGLLGFYNGINYGQRDQRLALKWVQQNIKDFGGDPNRVTVFGESSGAAGILWHLLTDKSKGLFHAAILQSSPMTSITFNSRRNAQAFFRWVALDILHCDVDDLACLRSKPADAFVILPSSPGKPTVANPLYPKVQVGLTLEKGELEQRPWEILHKLPDIPIILGVAQHEGSGFIPLIPIVNEQITVPLSLESFRKLLQSWLQFAPDTHKIMKLYKPEQYVQALKETRGIFALARDMISDSMFICPMLEVAAAKRNVKAYVFSAWDLYGIFKNINKDGIPLRDYGAYHCSETPYVFKAFTSWWSAGKGFLTLRNFQDRRRAIKAMHMAGEGRYAQYRELSDRLSCIWSKLHRRDDCGVSWPEFGADRKLRKIEAEIWSQTKQPESGDRLTSTLPSIEICAMWKTVSWQWMRD